MGRKPAGRRYRSLYWVNGTIYHEHREREHRIRFSTRTSDWDEAASVRDYYAVLGAVDVGGIAR